MSYELRPYQVECLQAIEAAWQAGVRRQLVVLPTGAGKTVVFSHLLSTLGWNCRMLVIAHREELLEQAATKIQRADPKLRVDIEQAQHHASDYADVVVASVATIGRRNSPRLTRWPVDHFPLIVCDEAHHSVAKSYSTVFEHFGAMSDGGRTLLVGVTATPERTDRIGLHNVYERVVYERNLRQMVEEGWLCRIRAWRVATEADLSGVHSRAGDYAVSELSRAVNTPERNLLAVRAYESVNVVDLPDGTKCAAQMRAIVFCADVQHSQDVAETFERAGIPAAAVIGTTSSDERKLIYERFERGDIRVLASCMVLTEGFDAPHVEVVIMARPTQSPSLYQQMIGRGTRLFPGKESVRIIDMVDNTRHDIPTVASLLGLPARWDTQGKDVIKQASELQQIIADMGQRLNDIPEVVEQQSLLSSAVTIEHARKLMREVNLLGSRLEVRRHTRFAWVVMPDGALYLAMPDQRAIILREDPLGLWHVTRSEAGRVLPMELTFDTKEGALAMADRFVRLAYPGAEPAIRVDARWRQRPASDGQRRALQRNGKWRDGLTCGEASDILNTVFGRQTVQAAAITTP